MKLLFDENISFRVVQLIINLFPGSVHVNDISALRQDSEIFEYAKSGGFAIVTFDEDFYDLQLINGHPPKIIWLRFGNSTNQKLTGKILENQKAIKEFLTDSDAGILEIY